MIRTHKIAMDPTPEQARQMARTVGYARVARNMAPADFKAGLDEARLMKVEVSAARRYGAPASSADPENGVASTAAGPPRPAGALPSDPDGAGRERFGTSVLTRRTSPACRISDPADAVLIPFSRAACSRMAYDAGGRSMVTLVDLAICCHPLPRYQFVTRSRPCPSSDDTRPLAHSSRCNCSALISSRRGPPRTGQANPARTS